MSKKTIQIRIKLLKAKRFIFNLNLNVNKAEKIKELFKINQEILRLKIQLRDLDR